MSSTTRTYDRSFLIPSCSAPLAFSRNSWLTTRAFSSPRRGSPICVDRAYKGPQRFYAHRRLPTYMLRLLTRMRLADGIAPETMGGWPKSFRNRHLDGDNSGKIFIFTAFSFFQELPKRKLDHGCDHDVEFEVTSNNLNADEAPNLTTRAFRCHFTRAPLSEMSFMIVGNSTIVWPVSSLTS